MVQVQVRHLSKPGCFQSQAERIADVLGEYNEACERLRGMQNYHAHALLCHD